MKRFKKITKSVKKKLKWNWNEIFVYYIFLVINEINSCIPSDQATMYYYIFTLSFMFYIRWILISVFIPTMNVYGKKKLKKNFLLCKILQNSNCFIWCIYMYSYKERSRLHLLNVKKRIFLQYNIFNLWNSSYNALLTTICTSIYRMVQILFVQRISVIFIWSALIIN